MNGTGGFIRASPLRLLITRTLSQDRTRVYVTLLGALMTIQVIVCSAANFMGSISLEAPNFFGPGSSSKLRISLCYAVCSDLNTRYDRCAFDEVAWRRNVAYFEPEGGAEPITSAPKDASLANISVGDFA